ncbi:MULTISPECIES: helix-turn-helix domain-containing protein [Actinomycetes]|uniref:helix-turn-helix transcriptional regulator n=1 Tax=Actinomycetes TaxID=1760 RepID=UPI0033BFC3AF
MASQTLAERTEILRPAGIAPLLATEELRAHFGVSRWTVNAWVKDKGCPVVRLPGGNRRFNLTAVEAWLAAQGEGAEQARAEQARRAISARY